MKQTFMPLEGYGTNFLGVFEMLLAHAKRYNISQEAMPKMLMVISDGQFDGVEDISDDRRKSVTERIKAMYESEGYQAPVLVYWNLRSYSNFPAAVQEDGVVMVSGFSPSALKTLLTCGTFDPMAGLLAILSDPRYDQVRL